MKIAPFGSGALVTWLRAVLQPVAVEEFPAGMDFAAGGAVSPGYDPENALSAYAAFPWVRACIDAIATDLSQLPRKVVVGEGDEAEEIEDHPVLDLLAAPSNLNGDQGGAEQFRQRIMDRWLTGNALRMVLGPEGADPTALVRMHPARWSIASNSYGGIAFYVHKETLDEVAASRVLHDRALTWENGPKSLWGTSPIQTLDADLTADHNASKLAAKTSANGAPSGVLSPKMPNGVMPGPGWDKVTRERLRNAYRGSLTDGLGLLISSGEVNYQPIGWTPRDMEFEKQRTLARHAILSVFDVPPTRVGLQSANYATAQMEARNYWQGLKGKAAELDAVDTALANMFRHPNQGRVRVVTDFSGVEALQESRTERVQRVGQLKLMGVPLADALRSEGFGELAERVEGAPVIEAIPNEEQATGTDGARLFCLPGPESVPSVVQKQGEPEEVRAAAWGAFIKAVHEPAERRMLRDIERALGAAGRRIAKNAEDYLSDGAKAFTEDEVAEALDIAAELAKMGPQVRGAVLAALEAGFAKAVAELGANLEWNAAEFTADRLVGLLISNILPLTRYRVMLTVNAGLEEGLSPLALRKTLEKEYAFSPSRAATIARTETTGAVESGQSAAYEAAKDAGVEFEMEWLTARDESVRDSHMWMDGQTPDDAGLYTSGDGNTTDAPGNFGVAAEDINCRCTRAARLKE